MERSVWFYMIPIFLLLTSAGIAGWTGWVVYDDNNVNTFKDEPNYLPAINVAVGGIAFIVFLANLFRVIGCVQRSGWCDSGLGLFTFILILGVAVTLYVQIGRLSKNEREYYEHELEHYYELTIGQVIYFGVYFVLVLLQIILRFLRCCSGCTGQDEYDIESETTMFV